MIVVLPLVACVPLQPPEAVQLVVLIDIHDSVVVPPAASVVVANFRVGAPGERLASDVSAASAWMNP